VEVAVAAFTHGEDCACQRCVGFQASNQLSRRHGGYSLVGISERAAEIADQVRPTLPAYSEADEPTLQLFSTTLARIERANRALDQVDEQAGEKVVGPYLVEDATKLMRLREDLRAWIGLARRLANDLGLTPTSRAKLGLDVASAQRAFSIVEYYRAREAAGLPVHDDDGADE
jgi:hypothetical protein